MHDNDWCSNTIKCLDPKQKQFDSRLSAKVSVLYLLPMPDMHCSYKVSGGSQVGPSLSVETGMLKRLSRILGLARRRGRVNAILDKCLVLSELGVTGSYMI